MGRVRHRGSEACGRFVTATVGILRWPVDPKRIVMRLGHGVSASTARPASVFLAGCFSAGLLGE